MTFTADCCLKTKSRLREVERKGCRQLREQAIWSKRLLGESNASGILERVGQRRRDRVCRGLADALATPGSDRIVGIGEVDLRPGDVGEGWDAVIAERRVDH